MQLSGETDEVDGELESHSICLHAEGLSDSSDILQVSLLSLSSPWLQDQLPGGRDEIH